MDVFCEELGKSDKRLARVEREPSKSLGKVERDWKSLGRMGSAWKVWI